MSNWGQYGSPEPPAGGSTGTVKGAVGLTMLAIALAVVEAIFAVFMLQEMDNPRVSVTEEDIQMFKIAFGSMIGFNLLISAALTAGALLALRRRVAGKVLIWIGGSVSAFMRCNCGGFAAIFTYLYQSGSEKNDSPLSTNMWTVLLAIEVLGLLTILAAMIMLITKGASFKDPNQPPPGGGYGPPAGYGTPPGYGPQQAPNDGLPNLPPSTGWPT